MLCGWDQAHDIGSAVAVVVAVLLVVEGGGEAVRSYREKLHMRRLE
jgi:hypothetical protein